MDNIVVPCFFDSQYKGEPFYKRSLRDSGGRAEGKESKSTWRIAAGGLVIVKVVITRQLYTRIHRCKTRGLKMTAEDRKDWQKLLRTGSHTPASQQITWMTEIPGGGPRFPIEFRMGTPVQFVPPQIFKNSTHNSPKHAFSSENSFFSGEEA